jgi:DNA-directed RNA polymerase specialized sigma subunit, sigma24 homolog
MRGTPYPSTDYREGSRQHRIQIFPFALREALECLSEEERNIVLLSIVGGLKSGEIAENTGMAPGSVRSSLSRSLKKVRGYLE